MCTCSGSKAPSRGRQYRSSKEGKEKAVQAVQGKESQGTSAKRQQQGRKERFFFYFFFLGGGFRGYSCLTHVSNAEHPPSQGTVATCSRASTRDISAAKAQEGNAAKHHSTVENSYCSCDCESCTCATSIMSC